jgi:hypothetical protein
VPTAATARSAVTLVPRHAPGRAASRGFQLKRQRAPGDPRVSQNVAAHAWTCPCTAAVANCKRKSHRPVNVIIAAPIKTPWQLTKASRFFHNKPARICLMNSNCPIQLTSALESVLSCGPSRAGTPKPQVVAALRHELHLLEELETPSWRRKGMQRTASVRRLGQARFQSAQIQRNAKYSNAP